MNIGQMLEKKGSAVYTIEPEQSIHDCIEKLNEKRVGALVVTDRDGAVQGIISERDILRAAYCAQEGMFGLKVRDVMTPREYLVVAARDEAVEAVMETMTTNRVRHLPILENEMLSGLVSIGDVIKVLLDELHDEHSVLKDYAFGSHYSPLDR